MNYRCHTKKENVTIKVICNQKNIHANEQLGFFNLLYFKHGIKKYGFKNFFFFMEIISIKPNYDSAYLFVSSK